MKTLGHYWKDMFKKILKAIQNPSLAVSFLKAKLFDIFGSKEFIGAIGNRSESDGGNYVVAVKKALHNYNAFCNFKRDPRYRAVLEHVNEAQGAQYLDLIRNKSPALLEKIESFKENDLVGGAATVNYPEIGAISPSTLRYIKVASDLRNLFGENIGERIAEIGVGYGGQLLIADKVLKFKQYDLFDLPPVLELTSKYLESHNLNSAYKTQTINQHTGDINYDLVISNYAFSELPSELQRTYIKKIIAKSKRGYLTMNSGQTNSAFQDNKLTLTELKNLLPKFELLPEEPLTHPGNYIIVWNGN